MVKLSSEDVAEDARKRLGGIVADAIFFGLHLVAKNWLAVLCDRRFGRAPFSAEALSRDDASEMHHDVGSIGDRQIHSAPPLGELWAEICVDARLDTHTRSAT